MKVQTQETGPGTYTLTVEVPAERVTSALREAFRRFSREVRLPGFRPGRVPRRLLEAQFGEGFLDEEVQTELIEATLPAALEEAALRPVSRPQTRVLAFADGQPFRYEVEVEVLPEIAFPEPETLEVEQVPPSEPDEAALEAILEDLRVRHATLVPKPTEEPAAFEDVAVIRLEEDEREILLEEDSPLARQLVGRRAGERVEVTLEGRTFALELVALKRLEKPDLEELATILGQDDEAALRAHVREELDERLAEERRKQQRLRALDALIAAAQVPVPPRFKEEAIRYELAALERSGRVGPLSEADRSAYAEGAEQRLRREVALEALKRQRGLKLSEEAFDKALQEAAERRGMHPVKFRALLEREGQLARFRSDLEDERALDWLVERVRWVPAPEKEATA